jgi:BMFP domain-containing protein YqiC
MKMTDYKATPEQWANVQKFAAVATESCLLELRARVEALEAAAHKHIVETSANILALASRVEALEATKRPTPKVYEINEPLQLTPEQRAADHRSAHAQLISATFKFQLSDQTRQFAGAAGSACYQRDRIRFGAR